MGFSPGHFVGHAAQAGLDRNFPDQGRSELASRGVDGKRLTYAEVTGVGAATSH